MVTQMACKGYLRRGWLLSSFSNLYICLLIRSRGALTTYICGCLYLLCMYQRLEPKEMSSKNLEMMPFIPPINSCSSSPIDLSLFFLTILRTNIYKIFLICFFVFSLDFLLISTHLFFTVDGILCYFSKLIFILEN